MSTIMTASNQWRSRPDDQRFTSLTDLNDFAHRVRASSQSKVLSNRALTVVPAEDNTGLLLTGPNGAAVAPTNWAFGQLCSNVGAPAGYLRELPSPLAADALNYGLRFAGEAKDVGVLLRKDDGVATLQAVTGPNYGRVWNSTVTEALVRNFGDGVTGDWRVPGEFGKAVEVTKANTTLYASDRDMFVFLADEQHRVELPNRRDGKPGSLAKGVFFWNSEVGGGTLGIAGFLYDYCCSNRIVWGATQYKELRIRHTASAPDKWIEECRPAITAYANQAASGLEEALRAAQRAKIDDVNTFLRNRFSSKTAGAIQAAHMADEQRPIESIWDCVTGVTAYARGIGYQNERVELEREAGKILELAAA